MYARNASAFQFGAQGAAKFDVGREQFVRFVEIPRIPHFIEETADKNFVLFQRIIERCDSIANADRATLENFRAKTGAVHHRSFDADLSERLEIRTGLAQTFAAKKHLADTKVAADEVVERDAARDEIAAHISRRKAGAEFGVKGFDGFAFDERDVADGTGRGGKGALFREVAIAFETLCEDGADGCERLHWRTGCRCGVDRDYRADGHADPFANAEQRKNTAKPETLLPPNWTEHDQNYTGRDQMRMGITT